MSLGPLGLTDPQTALVAEYRADCTAFIGADCLTARYGKLYPKLWLRDFYRELGVEVSGRPSKDELLAAAAELRRIVGQAGSVTATFPFRSDYGLKVTIASDFPFDSTTFQAGFHLSCIVFGWLDNKNGKLSRRLGLKKDHFYDLEKRYPMAVRHLVAPGVAVEAFQPGS